MGFENIFESVFILTVGFCQFIGIPGLIEPISDHTVTSKVGNQCNLLAADRANLSGRFSAAVASPAEISVKIFW